MELKIVARNLDLTDALKDYINKRLTGLERYSNNIIDSEFILQEIRGRYQGEVIVKVKGQTLTAKSQRKDPYEVIDELKDKIKTQLKKYEEKLSDRRG